MAGPGSYIYTDPMFTSPSHRQGVEVTQQSLPDDRLAARQDRPLEALNTDVEPVIRSTSRETLPDMQSETRVPGASRVSYSFNMSDKN